MDIAKYIILLWQGREQAVAFPQTIQHVDVFNYIQRDNPSVKAIAAGMFHAEPWWHGGESLTLDLKSRPEDAQLIQALLQSADRRLWDLRVLAWEACEVSRRRVPPAKSPTIAFG